MSHRRFSLRSGRLERTRSSRRAEREARTMSEWRRIAARNPRAVPVAVRDTLIQRGHFDRSHFVGA